MQSCSRMVRDYVPPRHLRELATLARAACTYLSHTRYSATIVQAKDVMAAIKKICH